MEIVMPVARRGYFSASFTQKLIKTWVTSCNDFLRWQRNKVIKRKPSQKILSDHRDTLKLMLRFGRSIHAQVSDPDFPLRQFAPEVAGKLRQLEKSWEMIHHPMSDAEAEAVLEKAFPH